MKTTEFSSAQLREKYFRIDHQSGLTVYVFPKKLTTAYALFTTKYGSIDNAFRISPDAGPIRVPDGIAHFLEHKLFDNADGSDSFERFAALGADANAYTSYTRTSYLFSCTAHFEEALEELLQFVTHPYFTPATVQKEQGIIAQEIRGYEDSPWERCFQLLMEGMYENHPVRKNICGSVESIAKITDQLLYDCHRVFYDLSNMVLTVCGDVTPEEVIAVADRVLPKEHAPVQIERFFKEEPAQVASNFVEARMPVAKPIFSIGIKDPCVPSDPIVRLRRDTALTLLDEILFSRAGDFYNELFESNVITPAFSGGYSCAEGFGFHSVSGESDTPELVLEKMKEYLQKVRREGLDTEVFERCRRVLYADELRSYDSTDEIANRLTAFYLEGVDMFSYLDVLQSITKDEVETLLDEAFRDEYFTLAVVRPLEDEESEDQSK